jgi:hypothetical protein
MAERDALGKALIRLIRSIRSIRIFNPLTF